ncbi:hypothetical protein STENM327S_07146 [Streptomyces tendae]
MGVSLGADEAGVARVLPGSAVRDAVGSAFWTGPPPDARGSSGGADRVPSVASTAQTEAAPTTRRPRRYQGRRGSGGADASGGLGAGSVSAAGLLGAFGAGSGVTSGPPSAVGAVFGPVVPSTAVSGPSAASFTASAAAGPGALPAVRGRWRADTARSQWRWSSRRCSGVAPHRAAKRSTGAKSSGTASPAQ